VIDRVGEFFLGPYPIYPIPNLYLDRVSFDNRCFGSGDSSRDSVSCFLVVDDRIKYTKDHTHIVVNMKDQATFLSIVASADEYAYPHGKRNLSLTLIAT
jgi:hypothetical protein